jgi:HSP20 family molecular chaperone IbpA
MTTPSNEMVRQETSEHVRAPRRTAPAVDVFENEDEMLLLVDVPGVEQDGLSIQLDGGQLDVEARQPNESLEDLEPVVFGRTFTVPNSIDPASVSAELNAGVLRIHLPKSEAAKPRRIAVTAV